MKIVVFLVMDFMAIYREIKNTKLVGVRKKIEVNSQNFLFEEDKEVDW